MQLSPNQKIFSEFRSAFPESTFNLEYFQKKDEPQRLFVSEIIDYKKRGYSNGEKTRVRKLMESQHVKGFETLHKYAWQFFWHVFWSLLEKIASKNCFSSIWNLQTVC